MVAPGKNVASSPDEALRQRIAMSQAIMLGTNVAVGMLLFTLLGYYVDHKRGTGSTWTLAGMIMGFLYGGYEFWSTVKMLRPRDPATPAPTEAGVKDRGGKPKETGAP